MRVFFLRMPMQLDHEGYSGYLEVPLAEVIHEASIRLAALPELCLSLFRSAYQARDVKQFYCLAVRSDWRVRYKLSYARKALCLRRVRHYG